MADRVHQDRPGATGLPPDMSLKPLESRCFSAGWTHEPKIAGPVHKTMDRTRLVCKKSVPFRHYMRPHRLAWSRTAAFHAVNRGSNPLGDAIDYQAAVAFSNRRFLLSAGFRDRRICTTLPSLTGSGKLPWVNAVLIGTVGVNPLLGGPVPRCSWCFLERVFAIGGWRVAEYHSINFTSINK